MKFSIFNFSRFAGSRIARQFSKKQGFSLIEMIVAIAVFAQVMLVATGALLSIIDANKKAQALQTVMNNLNFAVDTMSRNMRAGKNYHCGPDTDTHFDQSNDCSGGDESIAYLGRDPVTKASVTIRYYLSDGSIMRVIGGGTAVQITTPPPEIKIDRLKFYVTGASESPNTSQPIILMLVGGVANEGKRTQTRFDLETMISQRSFNS